jgi:hypothetical protein
MQTHGSEGVGFVCVFLCCLFVGVAIFNSILLIFIIITPAWQYEKEERRNRVYKLRAKQLKEREMPIIVRERAGLVEHRSSKNKTRDTKDWLPKKEDFVEKRAKFHFYVVDAMV